jgi:hypothetical protein
MVLEQANHFGGGYRSVLDAFTDADPGHSHYARVCEEDASLRLNFQDARKSTGFDRKTA